MTTRQEKLLTEKFIRPMVKKMLTEQVIRIPTLSVSTSRDSDPILTLGNYHIAIGKILLNKKIELTLKDYENLIENLRNEIYIIEDIIQKKRYY